MRGRKKSLRKKSLSKATKRLLSELFVTPLYVMKYKTWDDTTGVFGTWITIYTDGKAIYESQKTVPLSSTQDPLRFNAFVLALQDYVLEKHNEPNTIPRITVYDYQGVEKYKPRFNTNHPWCKR